MEIIIEITGNFQITGYKAAPISANYLIKNNDPISSNETQSHSLVIIYKDKNEEKGKKNTLRSIRKCMFLKVTV